ncbi:hypothetical protein LPJ72_004156 [Coemansia sp. Benny D160-2]|nr:hypothetical protein LPJ72_004156 [Coemansia sp. Benny D160-2]
MPTAKSGSSRRNMRLAFAIYAIAATTAVAAPVHILIPDMVTLPGGSAVTLYSAPSLNPASAGEIQTGAASEDAVISIDQDMLMRALSQPSPSPNASPNDPAQTPAATDYEEIGSEVARIRNAIMQVSDEPSASGDDNALNLSGILDKLTSSLSHAESSKVLFEHSSIHFHIVVKVVYIKCFAKPSILIWVLCYVLNHRCIFCGKTQYKHE